MSPTLLHMRSRGRPALKIIEPAPNRLRAWRVRRGLTQEQLAERSNTSTQHISAIERGEKQIMPSRGRLLAAALGCTLGDLLGETVGQVPVKYAIAHYFSAERPACFTLSAPHQMVTIGSRLADTQDYFAAEVYDDSANQMFAAGSILVFRPIKPGDRLRGEMRVLVRFLDGPVGRPADQQTTREVLFGLLDVGQSGGLYLLVPTTAQSAPEVLVIQRRQDIAGEAVSSPNAPFEQDYEVMPGANAVVLGELVWVSKAP